jgi:hypothetical protein
MQCGKRRTTTEYQNHGRQLSLPVKVMNGRQMQSITPRKTPPPIWGWILIPETPNCISVMQEWKNNYQPLLIQARHEKEYNATSYARVTSTTSHVGVDAVS